MSNNFEAAMAWARENAEMIKLSQSRLRDAREKVESAAQKKSAGREKRVTDAEAREVFLRMANGREKAEG